MTCARSIKVRGVVQGVGFRPFVFRLAQANTLNGWVLNAGEGLEIHLEGAQPGLEAFVRDLETQPPPAARISAIEIRTAEPAGLTGFTIRESRRNGRPSVRISPDLPVCADCLSEMFDPADPRFQYPYINCTNCGPRYSVIERLPYDRCHTTMSPWPLDGLCAGEYHDPANRRFHAQPVACPECGPHYYLRHGDRTIRGDAASLSACVEMLNAGAIVAVKGLGGYHLACDAANAAAVAALRERKYRKEKPFAVMVADVDAARALVELSPAAEDLLTSIARPIVLAPARAELLRVAPDNRELGVMLPYAPLHYLLFAAGAPRILVMTSANRSSEPIAYDDQDALRRLAGIADAFLIGERPIARRVDDSVVRAGAFGPAVLRRSRGYAPGAVAALPVTRPILAVGADLKNTVTLAVDGQAFVSQHIGDLDHYESLQAFRDTIRDLVSMYEVDAAGLLVAHDLHPQYHSTLHALDLAAAKKLPVQHHRAHIASVLAERGAWDKRVAGVSFDGTGYGDDGTIWGGEIFTGSIAGGFERVMHLRQAVLPGGDAAARHPVQSAAGFLSQLDPLAAAALQFPARYEQSLQLVRTGVRCFATTSMGRLFDAAAAVLGFTREITFEGQAAMWVEHLARNASSTDGYPFPDLDFRPLLDATVRDRVRGRDIREIARAFQKGVARGLCDAIGTLGMETVVLSGGVFQNELLLEEIKGLLRRSSIEVWTNRAVPSNDGGVSLGQAAMAAFHA